MYYLLLLIPIVISAIFYVFRKSEFKWWEFFIPIGAGLILIIIGKLIVDYVTVSSDEYWGSNVVAVYEEEPYNYWHHQICARTYTCGKSTCVTYYDCSHQEDVGPCWTAKTDMDEEIRLTEDEFEKIYATFKTSKNAINQRTNYDKNDRCVNSNGTKFEGKRVGGISYVYEVKWDGSDKNRVPYSSTHTYKNKIKTSDVSIFNLSVVDEKMVDSLKLYTYPDNINGLEYPTILGKNIDNTIQENFKKLNGKFGRSNQMRLWVLVFEDKPINVALQQENYWVRGNKNELVVCIGKKSNNEIDWCHVFSWSLSNELSVEIRNKVLSLYSYKDTTIHNEIKIPVYGKGTKKHKIVKYNTTNQDTTFKVKAHNSPLLTNKTWNELYDYMNNNLNRFQRRNFEEFDYLTVEPSTTSIVVMTILMILLSLGLNIWIVSNEYNDYEDDNSTGYYYGRNGRFIETKPNKIKEFGRKFASILINYYNKIKNYVNKQRY